MVKQEAVLQKICINFQVPRDCAADIQAYLRLFDTCPVAVRTDDPNFKAAQSMQTAVDTCSSVTIALSAAAMVAVVANAVWMSRRR